MKRPNLSIKNPRMLDWRHPRTRLKGFLVVCEKIIA